MFERIKAVTNLSSRKFLAEEKGGFMKKQDNKLQKIILEGGRVKSRFKSWISIMLCAVLIITVFSDISFAQHNIAEADKSTLSNPRIVPDKSRKARQKMKWDCIWFGSYPQAEVVPTGSEYTALPEEVFV